MPMHIRLMAIARLPFLQLPATTQLGYGLSVEWKIERDIPAQRHALNQYEIYLVKIQHFRMKCYGFMLSRETATASRF